MNVQLTQTEKMFVNHVLKMYAKNTDGLDKEDREEILDIANKFKSKSNAKSRLRTDNCVRGVQ